MSSEFQLIELFKKSIPRSLQGELPIGDDAGIFASQSGWKWVSSTDVIEDEVDFIHAKTPAKLVGRKALAVNLSDMAAMGAEPVAFVISLGLPKDIKKAWLKQFYVGMMALAKRYGVLCIGGDVSRSPRFFSSIAIMGRVRSKEILKRSGAKAGDWIGVTGKLGGSILKHHLTFEPRLSEARFLAKAIKPSALIDISDGFAQDLSHILKASKVGARMELNDIPVSQDAFRLARKNKLKAIQHALTDGEDFELLFSMSTAKKKKLDRVWKKRFPRTPLSWVGRVIREKQKMLWSDQGKRIRLPFKVQGYVH